MRTRRLLIAGIALIVLGVALAALPKDWIEETLGFEPDGGNGVVELLMAVVPIAVGIGLLTYAYPRRPVANPSPRPATHRRGPSG